MSTYTKCRDLLLINTIKSVIKWTRNVFKGTVKQLVVWPLISGSKWKISSFILCEPRLSFWWATLRTDGALEQARRTSWDCYCTMLHCSSQLSTLCLGSQEQNLHLTFLIDMWCERVSDSLTHFSHIHSQAARQSIPGLSKGLGPTGKAAVPLSLLTLWKQVYCNILWSCLLH